MNDHFWPGFAFGAMAIATVGVFVLRALLASVGRIVRRQQRQIESLLQRNRDVEWLQDGETIKRN